MPSFCRAAAVRAGEPLAGTAPVVRHWIGLEVRAPWGRKGYGDADLPEAVRRAVDEAVARLTDARVQLIRRPERREGPLTVLIARCEPGREKLVEVEVPALEEVAALDLVRLLEEGPARETPLVLVCTHGRRDLCCARFGMPVWDALVAEAPDEVWQTTHLGGHRFAATAAVLPSGVHYGQVVPAEASALLAAARRGEVYDPVRLRGLNALPAPAQVADAWLRAERGLTRLDAVRHVGTETSGAGFAVTLEAGGARHVVKVASTEAPEETPSSCGAEPTRGHWWSVTRA